MEQSETEEPGPAQDTDIVLDTKTGFPKISQKPFVIFNEGLTASWVTRIIRQTGRSNFVFEDFMAGAYFSIATRNLRPFDLTVRLAAFYPISYKFNRHPQIAANPLHYAFDLYAGPLLRFSMWDYVFVTLSAGLHFMYQDGERWRYVNLGAGIQGGFELPVAWRWTLLIDGMASLDYGNLGTNRHMEPYDFTWQYQVSSGVRYSKKGYNTYSYIPSKKRALLNQDK